MTVQDQPKINIKFKKFIFELIDCINMTRNKNIIRSAAATE